MLRRGRGRLSHLLLVVQELTHQIVRLDDVVLQGFDVVRDVLPPRRQIRARAMRHGLERQHRFSAVEHAKRRDAHGDVDGRTVREEGHAEAGIPVILRAVDGQAEQGNGGAVRPLRQAVALWVVRRRVPLLCADKGSYLLEEPAAEVAAVDGKEHSRRPMPRDDLLHQRPRDSARGVIHGSERLNTAGEVVGKDDNV